MKFLQLSYLLLIFVLLYGCASQEVAISARYPAKHAEAAQLTHIAVFDFDGSLGDEFEQMLISELSSATLDDQRYFTMTSGDLLKSRYDTRSVTRDRNLSKGLEMARSLGVQGVYVGRVADLETSSDSRSEERSECTEYKSFLKCEEGKRRTYNVRCYDQNASLSVDIDLINSRNGEVVYTDTVTRRMEHSYCRDDNDGEVSDAAFSRQLMGEIAEHVRHHVAPYNATMSVSLKTDVEEIEPQYVEKFKGALEFAESGQIGRACGIWHEIDALSSASKNSVSLIYNLGVCAESVANYDRAVQLYSKADSILIRPDKQVTEAKRRAMQLKQNQMAL